MNAGAELLVRRVDAKDDVSDALADVLVACVEGGASVSFLAPLARDKALAYWRGVLASAATGERVVLVAEADGAIAGTAQLVVAQPENQPHRADVSKMLVAPAFRRRGIGARLLDAIETEARAHGKTLLVLDTQTGSDAERLYARAGYTLSGTIPGYALSPRGVPCATSIFWKALAPVAS